MTNKLKLLHDLAIIEYMEYYQGLGYETINDYEFYRNQYDFIPDLVMQHSQTKIKIYFEFKSVQINSYKSKFYEFKRKVEEKERNAIFNLVVINEAYKFKPIIQFPNLNSIIQYIIERDYSNFLDEDINKTGKYFVNSTTITSLLLDELIHIEGDGEVSYQVSFTEDNSSVETYDSLFFSFLIDINGISYYEEGNFQNAYIEAKITFDEIA